MLLFIQNAHSSVTFRFQAINRIVYYDDSISVSTAYLAQVPWR